MSDLEPFCVKCEQESVCSQSDGEWCEVMQSQYSSIRNSLIIYCDGVLCYIVQSTLIHRNIQVSV